MFVHRPAERQEALELVALGFDDCEVSRRLGIPRRTIRDCSRSRAYTASCLVQLAPRNRLLRSPLQPQARSALLLAPSPSLYWPYCRLIEAPSQLRRVMMLTTPAIASAP